MTNIFIVVAILVLFFYVIQKTVTRRDETKDFAYKSKGAALNMTESAFYNALKTAVGDHGVVLAKVNMANLVAPTKTNNKKHANDFPALNFIHKLLPWLCLIFSLSAYCAH